jgi:exodeoxyribonuclease V alpha subunit
MDEAGETYRLASPTGKAAKRMTETTGRPATTIHRLLEWRGVFQRNARNPIEADVVIIDEVSMLDTPLACDLLDACGPKTRIVFVGDSDQLPSVGPGRVLADLVESGEVPIARLTTVHRAAMESWVCRNAPKVLSGGPLELEDCNDFRFVECAEADDCAAGVERVLIELKGAAQVLSPQRTTACGVKALNVRMQRVLNPASENKPEWVLGKGEDATTYRIGDRVIQTKNNYELEVFNGEVGQVVHFEADGLMAVDFGDRKVQYTKQSAFELDLAYALTVHKSQGSEFPWAIVVVHSAHTYMLTRNLLYTGITRAKKGVIIVGNRAGLRAAIEAKDPPKRNTKLVERMREILQPESAPSEPKNDAELCSLAAAQEIERGGEQWDREQQAERGEPANTNATAPATNNQSAPATVSDDIPW